MWNTVVYLISSSLGYIKSTLLKGTARIAFFSCKSFWINSASYGYKNRSASYHLPVNLWKNNNPNIYLVTRHLTWKFVWLFMCRYFDKQERIQLFPQKGMGSSKRPGYGGRLKAPSGSVAEPWWWSRGEVPVSSWNSTFFTSILYLKLIYNNRNKGIYGSFTYNMTNTYNKCVYK
jgi:hypothetical protein